MKASTHCVLANLFGLSVGGSIFLVGAVMIALGHWEGLAPSALAGFFLVVFRVKMPRPFRFRFWERLLDRERFARISRAELPPELGSTYWLSRAGRFSNFYRRPGPGIQFAAFLTSASTRSWGMLPHGLVFVQEADLPDEPAVLAIPRQNPGHRALEGSGFLAPLRSWETREVVFHGTQRPTDRFRKRLADLFDATNRELLTIELAGRYLALHLRTVPTEEEFGALLQKPDAAADPLSAIAAALMPALKSKSARSRKRA